MRHGDDVRRPCFVYAVPPVVNDISRTTLRTGSHRTAVGGSVIMAVVYIAHMSVAMDKLVVDMAM